MALSKTVLSTALQAKLTARGWGKLPDGTANPALVELCDDIADAVVAHITANAVVTVPLGVAVQVAVPAGTGATTAPGIGSVS